MSQASAGARNAGQSVPVTPRQRHNPFADDRFRYHLEWLMQLDPVSLRHSASVLNLITDFQKNQLAAIEGTAEHNERLLDIIRPLGSAAFTTLLEVLRHAFPIAEEQISELAELCKPSDDQHVEGGENLILPTERADISRNSPTKAEDSASIEADLEKMRSSFMN